MADLALLPALQALLSEANVTRAAMRLGISQPALSAKLRRLRDVLGDPLLVPSGNGRGMVLTPCGQQLRPEVEAAIATAAAVLGGPRAFDPATSEATVRIVANDNAATLALSLVLSELATSGASGLRIALLRPAGRSSAERLISGEADLAIGINGRVESASGLRQRPIVADAMVTVQRKRHPRGTDPFDMDAFCAVGHLLVASDSGGFCGVVDDLLARAGRVRRVLLSVHSYAMAPLIVAESDLVATLPRRLADRFADRLDSFAPPLDLAAFEPVILWHERTHKDPANRWIRNQIFAAV